MKSNGFTLIEVLVTVILVGIMAGVVIAIVRNHSDETQQTANDANLTIIQNRIEAYRAAEGSYPAALADLLNTNPPYLRSIPGGVDGWMYSADTGLVSRAE